MDLGLTAWEKACALCVAAQAWITVCLAAGRKALFAEEDGTPPPEFVSIVRNSFVLCESACSCRAEKLAQGVP